jgi:hypothetical protein
MPAPVKPEARQAPAPTPAAPAAVVERDSKGIYTLKPADSSQAKPAAKPSTHDSVGAD